MADTTRPYNRHGGRRERLYWVWRNVLARCLNPKNPGYRNYGGRGIAISAEWRLYETFRRDVGPDPGPEYSLERVNNDLGYSRDNCVWATRHEQARNRRSNLLVSAFGLLAPACDWAEIVGIDHRVLRKRVHRARALGIPEEFALSLSTEQLRKIDA